MKARAWHNLICLLALALALPASGCRNCDLVEAELRAKENDLRDLRCELARCEACNDGLMRELALIRRAGNSAISPELASQTFTLKQITLARGTGGLDDDGVPGDEALQVVVEPRDADGHPIKAPGAIHVEALEITSEGLKVPLSSWDLTPDQVRRTWRAGLFGTGYNLVLNWKTQPTNEKLRVVVRFTLLDGRTFEADKDVTIRLGKQAPLPKALPMAPAAPEPILEKPMPQPKGEPKADPKAPAASAVPEPVLPPPRELNPVSAILARTIRGATVSRSAAAPQPTPPSQTESDKQPLHEAVQMLKPQAIRPGVPGWTMP